MAVTTGGTATVGDKLESLASIRDQQILAHLWDTTPGTNSIRRGQEGADASPPLLLASVQGQNRHDINVVAHPHNPCKRRTDTTRVPRGDTKQLEGAATLRTVDRISQKWRRPAEVKRPAILLFINVREGAEMYRGGRVGPLLLVSSLD